MPKQSSRLFGKLFIGIVCLAILLFIVVVATQKRQSQKTASQLKASQPTNQSAHPSANANGTQSAQSQSAAPTVMPGQSDAKSADVATAHINLNPPTYVPHQNGSSPSPGHVMLSIPSRTPIPTGNVIVASDLKGFGAVICPNEDELAASIDAVSAPGSPSHKDVEIGALLKPYGCSYLPPGTSMLSKGRNTVGSLAIVEARLNDGTVLKGVTFPSMIHPAAANADAPATDAESSVAVYHPSDEIFEPFKLAKNAYEWRGHSGILDTRGPVIQTNGLYVGSIDAFRGLKFEKMISENVAIFEVIVNGEESGDELAVALPDSEPPDPSRPWRIFVQGPMSGTNSYGEQLTVTAIEFEGYYESSTLPSASAPATHAAPAQQSSTEPTQSRTQ